MHTWVGTTVRLFSHAWDAQVVGLTKVERKGKEENRRTHLQSAEKSSGPIHILRINARRNQPRVGHDVGLHSRRHHLDNNNNKNVFGVV